MFDSSIINKIRALDRKVTKLLQTFDAIKFAEVLNKVYPQIQTQGYHKLLALTLNKQLSSYSIQAADNVGLIDVKVSAESNLICTVTYETVEKAKVAINNDYTDASSPYDYGTTQLDCKVILNTKHSILTGDLIAKGISCKFLINTCVVPFYNNGVTSVVWPLIYNREELVSINKRQQEDFNQILGSNDESMFWLLFDAQCI